MIRFEQEDGEKSGVEFVADDNALTRGSQVTGTLEICDASDLVE